MRVFLFLVCLIPMILWGQKDELVVTRYEAFEQNSTINHLDVDKFNKIYVSTTNGLGIIGNLDDKPLFILRGHSVIDVCFHEKHGTWAATSSALYELAGEKEFTLPDKDAVIHGLDFFQQRLYIATDKGLFIRNMGTGKFENLNTRNSDLPSDYIYFVYADSKSRCWLGTKVGEVRIVEDDWQVDHREKQVTHYYENNEGLWFVSTDSKDQKQEMWLIDHYNRYYDAGFGPDLYQGTFNDFCIDSKGRLYFASEAFIRYDPYEERTENYTENAGVISSKCSSTVCDKNDNIWIGTAGEGLFTLKFSDNAGKALSVACITEKKPSCHGKSDGVVKVIATGGVGPFDYVWSNRLLSGSNPKNIGAGNYAVTVSDRAQNRQVCSIEVQHPSEIQLDVVDLQKIKSSNGKEGRIEVKASGGTGDLSYIWSNGSKKNFIEKLGAGDYGVTVSDKNKCTTTAYYKVTRDKILPDLDMKTITVGKTLRINELYFKADSTEISPESFEVLNELYDFLAANPSVVVEIGGHTNTIPPHEYCDKLSTERARTVAEYFYNKGIPVTRLSFRGYGKRQPISDSTSLEGRQKNQRVEVKVISM
ncbi:MAG: OmpA family protein [Saprospiraceae bacterium]